MTQAIQNLLQVTGLIRHWYLLWNVDWIGAERTDHFDDCVIVINVDTLSVLQLKTELSLTLITVCFVKLLFRQVAPLNDFDHDVLQIKVAARLHV